MAGGGVKPLLVAGRCCAVAGWILWVLVQLVARDPFPPEISMSQYGVGPNGWLFSLWVILLASGPVLLQFYRPVPGPARWLLLTGYAATWLMAIVRTDEGGLQMSTQAKVHMVGAVIALICLPLGMLLALQFTARPWRPVSQVLAAAAIVVGSLIVLSAIGLDTAGMGAASSWALWEGTLTVIEMLLVTVYALGVNSIAPVSDGRQPSVAPR
jgi:hypothetical protein